MSDEIVEFYWEVSKRGYEWIEAQKADSDAASKGLFLTVGLTSGRVMDRNRYRPLQDHSGLFRIFSEVEPTEEGILGFANKYGLLGADVTTNIRIPIPGKPDTMGVGEPIDKWKDQIALMRRVLDVWELARAGDLEGLSRLIHAKEKLKDISMSQSISSGLSGLVMSGQIILSPEGHPEILEEARAGDLVKSALLQVQYRVNEQLRGLTSPRILWDIDGTRLGLGIQPTSLLGAMWLQLARAIDGQKDYRQCKECQTWFELSPEVARTNRQYCSNACRIRAYRGRQEKAQEMNRQHKPISEIAKILGTDARTAKVWISRAKQKAIIKQR